jgi:hypothetical protein
MWCTVSGYSSGHATGIQREQRYVKTARCRAAARVSFVVVGRGLRLVFLGVVTVTVCPPLRLPHYSSSLGRRPDPAGLVHRREATTLLWLLSHRREGATPPRLHPRRRLAEAAPLLLLTGGMPQVLTCSIPPD